MKPILRIASLSDLHLGHPKNNTEDIIRNLKIAIPDNAETGELDLIFIGGDVFDDLLSLPDNDVTAIDLWIANLLHICEKHDIILRILEGTPSHDWKQSERFLTIAKVTKCKADVRYITELYIEYIKKLDINVLYVPDEWETDTDKTLAQVRSLLKAKGLTQVDYACMHGIFPHQIQDFIKTHKHDPEAYLSIVKDFIFIGHIHSFSIYDRIISNGSFDRLSHGEESPKGHIVTTVEGTDRSIVFVENKGAKIFKSIDCIGLDMDDTIAKIDKDVLSLLDYSHVRIVMSIDNPLSTNMNMLVRKYPLLIWTKLVKDTNEKEDNSIEDVNEVIFIPITITSDNIHSLLMDRLINDNTEMSLLKVAEELLIEVI